MKEPIYITFRQHEALAWICNHCTDGEWTLYIPILPGTNMNNFSKLITRLHHMGLIEARKATTRGDREVRVIVRHDDPRLLPIRSATFTPDKVAARAKPVVEPRPEPGWRPVPKRKLIPYAGYDGSSNTAW